MTGTAPLRLPSSQLPGRWSRRHLISQTPLSTGRREILAGNLTWTQRHEMGPATADFAIYKANAPICSCRETSGSGRRVSIRCTIALILRLIEFRPRIARPDGNNVMRCGSLKEDVLRLRSFLLKRRNKGRARAFKTHNHRITVWPCNPHSACRSQTTSSPLWRARRSCDSIVPLLSAAQGSRWRRLIRCLRFP